MKRFSISVWNLAFWVVIVCQFTVLPDTLGLGVLSRIANAATLLLFLAGALFVIVRRREERVVVFYLLPATLVAIGFLINIVRAGNTEALSNLGLLLPWVAMLSVPFVRGLDWTRYWKYFHWFMVWASVIALLEYGAVIANLLSPLEIETKRGPFLKGVFTIFHSLDGEDGIYFRLYGVFGEPGTYAMFLLPAIAYAAVTRKFFAVFLFLLCVGFTGSLGGYIGLALLVAPLMVWMLRGRHAGLTAAVALVGIAVLAYLAGTIFDTVSQVYASRGNSATTRESNVQGFLIHLLPALAAEPLGFPLEGQNFSELSGQAYYFGSNFSLATSAVTGGVLSFIGYLSFVLVNMAVWLKAFVHRRAAGVEAAVLLCLPALMSFIFQRTTILESALYAYLFAPFVIDVLRDRWMAPDRMLLHRLKQAAS